MTVFYKVIYSYETDKEDELAIKEGEIIQITVKDNPDWWTAERLTHSHEHGLVPSNFLEELSQDATPAVVIEDFATNSDDELPLKKNDIVIVTNQNVVDGWWKGELNGKTGLFPINHVELVDNTTHFTEGDSKAKKDKFKLAAFGVKQGGIGSILAGGFGTLKRNSTNRVSMNETSSLVNTAPSDSVPPPTTRPPPTPTTRPDTSNNMKKTNEHNRRAMVIHDYTPENEDELQLMRGEYIIVNDQIENNGWWKGTNEGGDKGVFPSNFVQIMEEEAPPPRPARSRPPTVKSDTSSDKEGMTQPPPIPVNTRPTSLLTHKDSQNSASTTSRPYTTPPRPSLPPPPRPVTTPTIPSRRSTSIISADTTGHRRTPSIPLMSPDLPPISPGYDRTSNRINRPVSVTSTDSPTKSNGNNHLDTHILNSMAKPPKLNIASKSTPGFITTNTARSPPSNSRPQSINDVLDSNRKSNPETVPPVPKRSMPPVPCLNTTHNSTRESPKQSVSSNPTTEESVLSHTSALPSTHVDNADSKLIQHFKTEIDKLRSEFEKKLEIERNERLRLEDELNELKSHLHTE